MFYLGKGMLEWTLGPGRRRVPMASSTMFWAHLLMGEDLTRALTDLLLYIRLLHDSLMSIGLSSEMRYYRSFCCPTLSLRYTLCVL